jgi:hypothetical protein
MKMGTKAAKINILQTMEIRRIHLSLRISPLIISFLFSTIVSSCYQRQDCYINTKYSAEEFGVLINGVQDVVYLRIIELDDSSSREDLLLKNQKMQGLIAHTKHILASFEDAQKCDLAALRSRLDSYNGSLQKLKIGEVSIDSKIFEHNLDCLKIKQQICYQIQIHCILEALKLQRQLLPTHKKQADQFRF